MSIKDAHYVDQKLQTVRIDDKELQSGDVEIRWWFSGKEAWLLFTDENPLLGQPRTMHVNPGPVRKLVAADAKPGTYQYAAMVRDQSGKWEYVDGENSPAEIIILVTRV